MSNINTEEAVAAYLNIRTERENILREYEAKDAKLKEDMAKIEALLLDVCNNINADSIRTSHGTIMRKLNQRFCCQNSKND